MLGVDLNSIFQRLLFHPVQQLLVHVRAFFVNMHLADWTNLQIHAADATGAKT